MESGDHVDPRRLATDLVDFLRPLAARVAAVRTLSLGKVNVLRHLATNERVSGADLAEAIGVSAQAISLVTKELQELGFVERHPDSQDRRRTLFAITALGRERLASELAASIDWLQEVLRERLSADEQRGLAAAVPLLNRLVTEADE